MTRVIIADDHAVVRAGMQMILEDIDDTSVVAEATSGNELVDFLHDNKVDLILLDVHMPGYDTMFLIKHIKQNFADTRLVIFTMNDDRYHMVKLLQAGADAFISKQVNPDEIKCIINHVIREGRYITPEQATDMANILIDNEIKNSNPSVLSPREFQILTMFASGVSNKEIALKLSLSKNTLSNHRSHILKKLNLTSNAELVHYAIKNGIVK